MSSVGGLAQAQGLVIRQAQVSSRSETLNGRIDRALVRIYWSS